MINTTSLGFLLLLALGAVAGAPVEVAEIEESYNRFQSEFPRDHLDPEKVKHARELIAQIEGSAQDGQPLPENLKKMVENLRGRVSQQVSLLFGPELERWLSDHRGNQAALETVFTPRFLRNYRNEHRSASTLSPGLVQILADNLRASDEITSGEQLLQECQSFTQGLKGWFEEAEELSQMSPAEVQRVSEVGRYRDEVAINSICQQFLAQGLPQGLGTSEAPAQAEEAPEVLPSAEEAAEVSPQAEETAAETAQPSAEPTEVAL